MGISDWRQQFGHLAPSYRSFMEMYPERFIVTPGKGNSYSVHLVPGTEEEFQEQVVRGAKGKRQLPIGGKGKPRAPMQALPDQGTEEDALRDITNQLTDPSNAQGKVYITDWRQRFGHLAPSYRAFMEMFPERFIVTP